VSDNKILFFANTDWYLYNFRLPLARYLRDQGHEVIMLSPPGPYVARLEASGFRALTIPMHRRSLNPACELVLLNHIRRLYTRERPDLVHHFTIKCVIYGSLAARLAGIPACVNAVTGLGNVFTSNSIKACLLRPPVRALLHLTLGGPNSRLILQNPDDVATFQQAGLIASNQIHLIRGSGVNTTRFHPASQPTPSNPLKILLATRLLREKGVGEYVAAARQLRQEGITAEFLLAGDPDPGNPSSVPSVQLTAWRQEGSVTLLGHVEDMAALWPQVDIAVLPSYREGTPRSLLEAAACGLPLVATDVPGCREIVQHDINGLLVPIKDATALAAALRQLYQDPTARQRMGQASRAKALAEFDERLVFDKTLAVYQEVLK